MYFWYTFHLQIQILDDDLKKFLVNLRNEGVLNRSMLILLSDHGSRYSKQRDSLQGKLEERLPIFVVSIPSWFRNDAPFNKLWTNLIYNAASSLATPYDLDQTFKHILQLSNSKTERMEIDLMLDRKFLSKKDIEDFISFNEIGENGKGTSLFQKIDSSRTCNDAGVPMHFCPCLSWIPINLSKQKPIMLNLINKSANFMVEKINELTNMLRSQCEKLSVKEVRYAFLNVPSKESLKFWRDRWGGAHYEGGWFRSWTQPLQLASQLREINLELWIETIPGKGKFEGHVKYLLGTGELQTDWKLFSRTNKYGDQPDCIARQFPHLRQFCYCYDQNIKE